MKQYLLKLGVLVAFLSMGTPVFAFGIAGQSTGDVSVINQDGLVRPLVKSTRVESRETIITAENSEVLLQTDDDGLILLKANSKLYIASYHLGNGKSQFVGRLLKGSIYGETGRIGKSDINAYRLYTPNAIVKLQGAQYAVELTNVSTRTDTYVKVDRGQANLSSRNISLNVDENKLAVATSSAPPQLLELTPNGLFATPMLNTQAKQMSEVNTNKLALKSQSESALKSANRIPLNCAEDSPAQRVLDDFISAYERGDSGYIQRRLDPSMIGYGAFLNSMMKDINTQKQTRFLIQNRNVQCGPDLAVINFRWEKRFLDLSSFTPRLQTGQASILTHLKSGEWKLSGISGDNPFAPRLGQSTLLAVAPSVINAGTVGTLAVSIAGQIKLTNPDLIGVGSVQIQATSSTGDSEAITLTETTAGVFIVNTFNVVQATPIPNDGALNINGGGAATVITLSYTNPKTGAVAKNFIKVIAF